jgi:hypothetical protein
MLSVLPWSGWRGCWVHFHVKPLDLIVILLALRNIYDLMWMLSDLPRFGMLSDLPVGC